MENLKYILVTLVLGLLSVSCSDTKFSSSENSKRGAAANTPPPSDSDQASSIDPDPIGINTKTGEVTCEEDLDYDPQSVQCQISPTDLSSVWSKTDGWNTSQEKLEDKNARWISPLKQVLLANGSLTCPSIPSTDLFIYVSSFKVSVPGNYRVEIMNDDRGHLRFWKNANPNEEVVSQLTGSNYDPKVAHLTAGSYTIVLDSADTGKVATGIIMSIKSPDGNVIKRSVSDGSWCIFRIDTLANPNFNITEYVLKAASCRKCFYGN